MWRAGRFFSILLAGLSAGTTSAIVDGAEFESGVDVLLDYVYEHQTDRGALTSLRVEQTDQATLKVLAEIAEMDAAAGSVGDKKSGWSFLEPVLREHKCQVDPGRLFSSVFASERTRHRFVATYSGSVSTYYYMLPIDLAGCGLHLLDELRITHGGFPASGEQTVFLFEHGASGPQLVFEKTYGHID
jgi:hypothetical protein